MDISGRYRNWENYNFLSTLIKLEKYKNQFQIEIEICIELTKMFFPLGIVEGNMLNTRTI